jgi:large subunit ribosomal protein L18
MSAKGKLERRTRRKGAVRRKVSGTAERPRVTVFRSGRHIYVQAIDDISRTTIAAASSLNDEGVRSSLEGAATGVAIGSAVGKALAARLKEKNVTAVVFDRNGYLYHGRVRAVAEGVREGGLQM